MIIQISFLNKFTTVLLFNDVKNRTLKQIIIFYVFRRKFFVIRLVVKLELNQILSNLPHDEIDEIKIKLIHFDFTSFNPSFFLDLF